MIVNEIYNFSNPYFACYPYSRFNYLDKQDFYVDKERIRYFELIKKSFKYAYGFSIEEANKKILNYLKIGNISCANDLANKVNDIFYFMAFINNTIFDKILYNTPTCQKKEFIDCLKKYWYCKKIDITNIINEFELEICKEDGIDYMIIIDPMVNPNAIPPNQVR